MRVISTNDFRGNLANYINEVYTDKTPLLVGRFNKPLVVVKPFDGEDLEDDFMKFYGFMGGGSGGGDFLAKTRRSNKEKTRIEKLRKRNV